MRAPVLIFFGACCLVGLCLDMFSSVFGLLAIAKVDFWVARVMVGGLGIIITLGVASTKYVSEGRAPIILILLWMICTASDIATNVISFTHFVVQNGNLTNEVIVTPKEIWAACVERPDQAVIGAVGLVVVCACSIGALYCLDQPKPNS